MTSQDDMEKDDLNLAGKKKDDGCWDDDCKKQTSGPSNNHQEPIFKFNKGQFKFSIWYFIAAVIIIMLINSFVNTNAYETVSFSTFKELISNGTITEVQIGNDYYLGVINGNSEMPGTQYTIYRTVPVDDVNFVPMLDSMGVKYSAASERSSNIISMLLGWVIPFALIIVVWRFMFNKMGGSGSGVMNFGKNNAQLVAEGDTGTTFEDVAGADEAKEELVEVVDFLKNPKKYLDIGGKIPKGVLLVGSPGTGKTLLARAVAGDAGVPFFRLSGADFVEMFVGVGAARVRDLFKQAREKAPCIVFIDELDAIGKSRLNVAGGNDEREQTLNQLLVEMDGFSAKSGVIILGATNRPEVLDAALLRPGRFDRQVVVDKPDLTGREAILRIHSSEVKMGGNVDLHEIAKATPGFVGADLANIINESALLAVRAGRSEVKQEDLEEAIEKTMAGLQKKNRVINKKERNIVAYHETGHAITAAYTEGADPVQKISIIPRGIGALGYTLQTPTEDRFLMTKQELLGKIDVLLGGRAAEEIIFEEVSTGASNDITRATDIARSLITEYGMSDKFENMALTKRSASFLGQESGMNQKEYAETTQQYIDEEVANIIRERYKKVIGLLKEKRETLESITSKLLEQETISSKEFFDLAGLSA
ncbi:MAG: ATP-dependent zinc metalloprotease FtsH [Spirochaetales bacterium]|uniref:ATP-dependent zinc metalloprotease FtsH n=1 Tax=Candidatus Thalassospirochaeta sargassi TaxID=3119039 RepID=A0AAJ1IFQ9_9SPIO|nr:ATP-dependent zinc metalloprotease FtsH [Spirochaetales bacterium]